MNVRLVAFYLSVVVLLMGVTMLFSIPWALLQPQIETWGIFGLSVSCVACLGLGSAMRVWGRPAQNATLYRREAMAVVGLAWVLATILGALPYLLSGSCRDATRDPKLATADKIVRQADGTIPRENCVPMSVVDALFEAQSGFSTTGATVLSAIQEPQLVPRCILFWRSSTHFLGGLGIMVLLVAVLGQGSRGKALMRAELTGPSKETGVSRMQHAALVFTSIYVGLNAVLTALLMLEGMSFFDAICHSFGTIATGGFSTYDASVAHFQNQGYPYAFAIEMTLLVFMAISGMNFSLIYFVLLGQPGRMFADREWRVYMGLLLGVSVVIALSAWHAGFFHDLSGALRYGSFAVASIVTTTGFATSDFDHWDGLSRGLMFLLLFSGACAGSTSGGVKIIRYVLLTKVLGLEIEKAYRPNVVRQLRLGDDVVDETIRHQLTVYFCLVLVVWATGFTLLMLCEPASTWTSQGLSDRENITDCLSAVGTCFSNAGPGLGTIGPVRNYGHLTEMGKLILSVVMLLGRVEIIVVLLLVLPGFWKAGGGQ